MRYNEYRKPVNLSRSEKIYEYEFDGTVDLIKFIDNNEPYKQWYRKELIHTLN